MIRVAYGERLAISQADVKLNGWAVESRVYAEDPTRNFLPSTGRLVTYRPPAEGRDGEATVRNDTGVYEGGEISIYYDPMIAKLVTHAPTREAAIRAQARALDAFAIDGIRHNIPFVSALMQHPRWIAGELSTGFIAEEFPEGFALPQPQGEVALRMAAIAIACDHRMNQRKRNVSAQMQGWRKVEFERARIVELGGERFAGEVSEEGGAIVIAFGERRVSLASDWRPGEPVWQGTQGGIAIAAQVRPILNGFALGHAGAYANAHVYTAREAQLAALMPEKAAADTGKFLLCPMPGLVKALFVSLGQEVKAGEPLAMVEAMKMENVLRAEKDVTIAKILAKEGDSLAVDAVIIEFK
jgi:propionyl-CoA carboxylase alpha chain